MKAFKVVFKHGHFIDVESKLRLIPVQGAEYIISAVDTAFTTEDAKLKMNDALNSKDKANWAEKEYGQGNYDKIMDSGEKLFYRVGNSKKVPGDENQQYIFVCKLLEDLYLYKLLGRKGNEVEDWRLADCKCELEECIMGGMILSEKIQAKSLNALFNNTVQFYFSMQRSGSASAFETFFKYEKGIEIYFEGAINQIYYGLKNMRKEFVSKRGIAPEK